MAVIPFPPSAGGSFGVDPGDPRGDRSSAHLSGRAVCLACRHEWVAVAPVRTTSLECPACTAHRGVWADHIALEAADDLQQWTCRACDSTLFSLYRRANGERVLTCAGCGWCNNAIEAF